MEPANENPLFNHANVVCTPHLGASTTEAQENVALQVAEQMSDYLLTGAVQNALNMPNVTAEEAAVIAVDQACQPSWQLHRPDDGRADRRDQHPLRRLGRRDEPRRAEPGMVIAGVLKTQNPDVNLVSAPWPISAAAWRPPDRSRKPWPTVAFKARASINQVGGSGLPQMPTPVY